MKHGLLYLLLLPFFLFSNDFTSILVKRLNTEKPNDNLGTLLAIRILEKSQLPEAADAALSARALFVMEERASATHFDAVALAESPVDWEKLASYRHSDSGGWGLEQFSYPNLELIPK